MGRKKTEISNDMLQQFTSQIAFGYFELDLNGVITYLNPAAIEICGLSLETAKTPNFRDILIPEDIERASANLQKTLEQKQSEPHEYQLVTTTQETRRVMVHTIPMRNSDGAPTGFMGTVHDITQQRKTEAKLADSLNAFDSFRNDGAHAYFELDLEGNILYANKRLEEITGLPFDKAKGANCMSFLAPGGEEAAMRDFALIAEKPNDGPRLHKLEFDGKAKHVEINCIPIFRMGEITGFHGTMADVTDRVEALRALERNEERLRSIYENCFDIVFENDGDGNLVYVSPSVEQVLGYTVDELIGQSFGIFVPESDQARAAEAHAITQSGGKLERFRLKGQRKDGTIREFEINAVPVQEDGKTVLVRGIGLDITEQHEINEALATSERRFRALIETSPSAVTMCDLDGRLIYVSPPAIELHGFADEKDMLGKSSFDLIAREDHEKAMTNLQNLLRDGIVRDLELTLLRKDGSRFIAERSAALLRDRDNRPMALMALTSDITDRKEAEIRLQESEDRFRKLFEHSNDAIFLHDLDGIIYDVNQRACELLGYSREEMLAKKIPEFYPPEDGEVGSPSFDEAAQKGAYRSERRLIRKDGSTVYVEISARVIDQEKGFVQGVVRDITQRMEAERQRRQLEGRLQRAEKMEALGTLAGGVAHDLNNILWGLVSYPDLLLMNLDEDSPLRDAILTIQQSGQKAVAVVQDLLTLARRGVAVTDVVNINAVIEEYMESLEYEELMQANPGIIVHAVLAPNIKNNIGSPVHLSKTIMNLISNAVEAMPDGGDVHVRSGEELLKRPRVGYETIPEGRYNFIEVEDTGIGISEHDLEKIFEPFYTKKVMNRSGTGLGMAVVWGTVKDHHGFIDIDSTEGEGSRFRLYFPVTDTDIVLKDAAVSTDDLMGNGELVLVVDDIHDQREIAAMMLTRLGYNVDTVRSGEEAEKYVRHKKPDLVLLDMIMDPGIDGLETYKRLVTIHPGQKAVIGSGFSETELVHEAQELGAGIYLKKPFTMQSLGKAVQAELQN